MATKGLVGLIPLTAQVGHEVCVVNGSKLPLLLSHRDNPPREASEQIDDEHNFVADCCVNGIMMGEAVEGKVHEQRNIRIF